MKSFFFTTINDKEHLWYIQSYRQIFLDVFKRFFLYQQKAILNTQKEH